MTRLQLLPGLEPGRYQRHMLHADTRVWVEKNCYVDVCIELLHSLGLEPLAAMGACAVVDFDGDSFTFFKPSHEDLRALFGVDVQELNVWLPLIEHAANHLGDGRFIATEADSYYLPDTEGTDYRRNHVKTTIILADLDAAARRLGYFHNAGYHMLAGEDFEQLFRLGVAPDPTFMPLYAEVVRVDQIVRRPATELARMARELLAKYVARRPADNPMVKFQRRFERDLPSIQRQGLAYYHAWAFATVRQAGGAFELLALHLRWLAGAGDLPSADLVTAAEDFERVSVAAKTFILKAARAVNTGRPFDASPLFDEMAQAWERGMSAVALSLAHDAAEQSV